MALKNNLATYDGNGYTYYDSLKTIATHFYHKIHADLLDKLYNLTSDPLFKKYRDKWKLYSQEYAKNSPSTPGNFKNYIQLDAYTLASSEISQNLKTPKWIKNNVKWWTGGQISDSDFIQGIQYLIEKGITNMDITNNAVSQAGLEIDQNTFDINRDGITVITISGTIQNYKSGVPVILKIAKPDHDYYEMTIFAKSNGEFITQLLLDKNSTTGAYVIEVNYSSTRMGASISMW